MIANYHNVIKKILQINTKLFENIVHSEETEIEDQSEVVGSTSYR